MLAAAQDAAGATRVRPLVEKHGITFPVLLDPESALARGLGFRRVPSGFFVDEAGVLRYRHVGDFDVADPRVRWNLERFVSGEKTEPPAEDERMEPAALDLFAGGVALYAAGDAEGALAAWRKALAVDPDNFIVRSQIWALEHPERFYPAVDRAWQERRLLVEGYDKPLP
jgi:hypothetical protein